MTKQNLFVPQVKNHVNRNAFDMSHRKIYSSKIGEILPCLVQDCLPGDKFKVNASSFSRTAPLNEAAFCRMKQYYNFYFVPYRLLYRDFPSFVVSQSKSSKAATGISSDYSVPTDLPYATESDLRGIAASLATNIDAHSHTWEYSQPVEKFLLNEVGLNRMVQTRKLLQYLGYYKLTSEFDKAYGENNDRLFSANNSRLSLFPLLAYQKVYNDFYRFSQWENEQANTYNLDYMASAPSMKVPIRDLFVGRNNSLVDLYPKSQSSTMFDMRYVNFVKDTFLGVVPSSQFGAKSTVRTTDSQNLFRSVYLRPNSSGSAGNHVVVSSDNSDLGVAVNTSSVPTRTSFSVHSYNGSSFDSHFSFDILTLRAAQAKQKFLEVTLSNNSDYKSQIEAHFNVNVSSLMSGLCDYIGGFSSDLSINTVTNNNLTDGNVANYSATANFGGNGSFDFECKEHGLLIGVTYTLPFIDYMPIGYDFPLLRTTFDDFALPEYDKLGFEELDTRLLNGNLRTYLTPSPSSVSLQHLGFGPRYYDYKTAYDVCLGDFNYFQGGTQPNFVLTLKPNLNNLDSWRTVKNLSTVRVLNVSNGLLSDLQNGNVTWRSFKVSPQLANNVFNVACGIFWDVDPSDKTKARAIIRDDTSFDCLYNVIDFNITKISNLDRLGLPY